MYWVKRAKGLLYYENRSGLHLCLYLVSWLLTFINGKSPELINKIEKKHFNGVNFLLILSCYLAVINKLYSFKFKICCSMKMRKTIDFVAEKWWTIFPTRFTSVSGRLFSSLKELRCFL